MVGKRNIRLPPNLDMGTGSYLTPKIHRKANKLYCYHFWLRIGMALIPDITLALISFILILNPVQHSIYSFHPVFALMSSFVMMVLYVQVCWLNPLIALSNKVVFNHQTAWENIVFAETGLESVICLLCIAMLVYSCIAVHKWRIARKGGMVKMGTLPREERVQWRGLRMGSRELEAEERTAERQIDDGKDYV
ncbi:hypothetical protein BDU57DRAFT_521894 [Ampelomyces quisqualis]|uniref:MARVEL domain-containing protein n=1 Tax=Ampelomyces quisqualis TaxID=50730 RepID=A0A6A5QC87_AMPQU|nr:hypothetical protein BDU57DRAFT_521894 [Ampelomyces quisqualis]